MFLEQFYTALFAAAFGLVPILLLGHRSSGPALGEAIIGTVTSVYDLLPIALAAFRDGEENASTPPGWDNSDLPDRHSTRSRHDVLAKTLKSHTGQISPLLKSYSNEIIHARLPSTQLRPIIAALKAVSRNPLLGSSSQTPGERVQAALLRARQHSFSRPTSSMDRQSRGSSTPLHIDGQFAVELDKRSGAAPFSLQSDTSVPKPDPRLVDRSTELSGWICAVLTLTGDRIAGVWCWTNPLSAVTSPDPSAPVHLNRSIGAFEIDLEVALDSGEGISTTLGDSRIGTTNRTHGESESFRLAFHMVTLLDLGRDVLKLHDVVARVTEAAPVQKRWYVPYLHRWIRSRADAQPVDVLDHSDIAGTFCPCSPWGEADVQSSRPRPLLLGRHVHRGQRKGSILSRLHCVASTMPSLNRKADCRLCACSGGPSGTVTRYCSASSRKAPS